VTTTVREFTTCWVVDWNSRAHVESGRDILDALPLPGSGPIIVNRRTGSARMAVPALPVEDQLDCD